MRAPVVVIAVGNPSRGDDAIGPELAARLECEGLPWVEVIVDYQLQVEHALDLEDRQLAVFVDAAVDCAGPVEVRPLEPCRDASHTTHALSPAAVLETCVRITGQPPPPACALAVRGVQFGLGDELSDEARRNVEAAWPVVLQLVRDGQKGTLPLFPSQASAGTG
jgi:hydrogenase maturation protease